MSTPLAIGRVSGPLFGKLDVILLSYYALFAALVLPADRPGAAARLLQLGCCALLLVVACAFRAVPGRWRERRVLAHRTTVMCLLIANYVMLRDLLPLVQRPPVDAALAAWDRLVFGSEPVFWLERFNTPLAVEYFSFFYLSYFLLTLVVIATVLFIERPGKHVAELTTGTALVYCIGQLGYIAVPGYGPVVYLADGFAAPLQGGPLYELLLAIVGAGGALTDVFPSLHTAVPIWFTLYASRRAATDARWRVPAVVIGFFAANIVCSTLVLRWHYGVDLIAGLLLALAVFLATPRLLKTDSARARRQTAPRARAADRSAPRHVPLQADPVRLHPGSR